MSAPGATEVALLSGGRLLSSQLLPAKRLGDAAALERSVARQLAETALAAENVPLYRWELANGAGPGVAAARRGRPAGAGARAARGARGVLRVDRAAPCCPPSARRSTRSARAPCR